MNPLVIIVGPTAVGKSALGIALAQAIGGEIISGDSVQVYRKLDIGSAKPTIEEQQNIPHHLMDCLELDEPFTVAQFQSLAREQIDEIQKRGKIPIIVGGTGLYIRSLLDPFDFAEVGSQELRAHWSAFLVEQGKEALHQALQVRDPRSAERLHPNDTVRIIRALEMTDLIGKPFSEIRGNLDTDYATLDPSILYIGLTAPREVIYERINRRCELMLSMGLLEETQNIISEGFSPKLKPLQSIGYRHAIWYLTGKVTLPEVTRVFQRDTRHFAKRQLTWFRRDSRITWFDTYHEEMTNILESLIKTCGRMKSRVE